MKIFAIILVSSYLGHGLNQNAIQNQSDIMKLYGDINYFLCTRKNTECLSRSTHLNLNLNDANINLPLKLIIHGFTENISVEWYKEISRAYLIKDDYNLVLVDWSKKANLMYPEAAISARAIGNSIGDFLIKLFDSNKIPLNNVHIIGHSLGSHVAGFVGKRIFKMIKRKVQRITGLDPAGPLFEMPPKSMEFRLSKEDAEFVDIVHTDGGFFGFKASIGHADFFPNGDAGPQPGCEINNFFNSTEYFCSHHRSYQFFIESINSKEFVVGKPCDSWELYKMGFCDNNTKVPFGEGAVPNHFGNFYFRTNSKKPYAIK